MADHERKKQQKGLTSRRKFIAATALAGVGAGVAFAEKKACAISKAVKGKRYGMVIDLRRCVGCHVVRGQLISIINSI